MSKIIYMLSTNCRKCLFLFVGLFVFFNSLVPLFLGAQRFDLNNDELGQDLPSNDHDLYVLLSKPENFGKTAELFFDIVNEQNSMISRENLLKLVEMKQQSISNFRCKYTVFMEMFDESQNPEVNKKISYEFVCSKNKLYIGYEPHHLEIDDPPQKIAYDGEKVLSLLSYPSGHLHAGLGKPDAGSLMGFFQTYMPLTLAMLFDPRLCEFDFCESNLMLFLQGNRLYGIFEKMEIASGQECIVIADLYMRLYLDPQKDFSVIQSDSYRQEFSDDGILVGRWLASRSKLFDLTDHGNGVWIPSKAVIENFDKFGKVTARCSVDVSLVEINKGIDDNFFTGFIPNDTLVADTVEGLVYVYGDRPSINSLLKDVAKSKRVFILQYISVTVGILLILIVLIVKYLAYRKRKNAEQRESSQ